MYNIYLQGAEFLIVVFQLIVKKKKDSRLSYSGVSQKHCSGFQIKLKKKFNFDYFFQVNESEMIMRNRNPNSLLLREKLCLLHYSWNMKVVICELKNKIYIQLIFYRTSICLFCAFAFRFLPVTYLFVFVKLATATKL